MFHSVCSYESCTGSCVACCCLCSSVFSCPHTGRDNFLSSLRLRVCGSSGSLNIAFTHEPHLNDLSHAVAHSKKRRDHTRHQGIPVAHVCGFLKREGLYATENKSRCGTVLMVGATLLTILNATQGVRTTGRCPTSQSKRPSMHRPPFSCPEPKLFLAANVPMNSCTVPRRHGRKTHQPENAPYSSWSSFSGRGILPSICNVPTTLATFTAALCFCFSYWLIS